MVVFFLVDLRIGSRGGRIGVRAFDCARESADFLNEFEKSSQPHCEEEEQTFVKK